MSKKIKISLIGIVSDKDPLKDNMERFMQIVESRLEEVFNDLQIDIEQPIIYEELN